MGERIGRYRVIRLLGQGGFGRVYFASDDDLGRSVAIKVTHAHLLESPFQVEAFLSEARLAARLNHPSIVTVHDVGREDGIGPFMVMEHVEGQSLDGLFRAGKLAPDRLARLPPGLPTRSITPTAGAGARDLKPGNILIDADGEPHVTDFGMAVTEDLQCLKSGEIAGTPHFMAPEQVRGETHRLDGRTDLWGLGVIFYLGLTVRVPFDGGARTDVFDQILYRDPRPPRLIDGTVPRELERICLKCLAKPMSERYASAADLAEDLRSWLATGDAEPRGWMSARSSASTLGSVPKVVPKGLRSFDVEDADFFLALLPGPRDRDGLPEPIRFWKTRIEEADEERSFSVGVIYGRSGCGKTSLVKAGLLPVLVREYGRSISKPAWPGPSAASGPALRGLPGSARRMEPDRGNRRHPRRPVPLPGREDPDRDRSVRTVAPRPSNDPEAESDRRPAAVRRPSRPGLDPGPGRLLDVDQPVHAGPGGPAGRGSQLRGSRALRAEPRPRVLAEFGRAWDRLPDNPAATTAEQTASSTAPSPSSAVLTRAGSTRSGWASSPRWSGGGPGFLQP